MKTIKFFIISIFLISFISCEQEELSTQHIIAWEPAEEYTTTGKTALVVFVSDSRIKDEVFETVWYYKNSTGLIVTFTLTEKGSTTNDNIGDSSDLSSTGEVWFKNLLLTKIDFNTNYKLDHVDMKGKCKIKGEWIPLKTQTWHPGDDFLGESHLYYRY